MKKTEITKLFNVYMNCDRFGVVHGNEYVKISEILSFEDLMRLYLVHKSLREEGFLQPVIFFEFINFDIAFLHKKKQRRVIKGRVKTRHQRNEKKLELPQPPNGVVIPAKFPTTCIVRYLRGGNNNQM